MRCFRAVGVAVVVGTATFLGGCGLNPFGAGQSGLKIFASIAKAVQKPSQIDDEKNSKQGAKAMVAQGAAKRLAKAAAPFDKGVDSATVISHGGIRYTYIEYMRNKPSEEDPDKLLTGIGKVSFSYSPGDPTQAFDANNITAVDSFFFQGREFKTWNGEICSLVICVRFDDPNIGSLKPGLTWVWGKNISGDIAKGHGDTAFISVYELNDAEKKQYGKGCFYDANAGRNNSGESFAFNFSFEVWHMEDNPPYSDYSNNEGEMSFALPWGASSDSLYFRIHYYPNYLRSGTITDSKGVERVRFNWNEKLDTGTVTYYNENGEVVETE